MMWMKRGLIAIAILAVLAFLAFNIFKKPIANALFNRVMAERVGVDATDNLRYGLNAQVIKTAGWAVARCVRRRSCLCL